MYRELLHLDFSRALEFATVTHIMGGHLDQVFARRVEITNALVNDGFDSGITDHKCVRVTLKLKSH